MKSFLQYVDGDSILHRLNPLTKLIIAVTLCLICFMTKSIFCLVCIFFCNLIIGAVGKVFKAALVLTKGLIKLSIVLFLLQIFFVRDGNVLFSITKSIFITDNGVYVSMLIVLRLICATLPLSLMLNVTKINDLLNVMCVKLHIPYPYAFSLMTAIRFIPVFSLEMEGIMEAQIMRGIDFDTKNIFRKMKLILPLCLPLLVTSVKKIEGSASSAELRGFEYRNRNCIFKQYPMLLRDITAVLLCVFVIAAFVIIKLI